MVTSKKAKGNWLGCGLIILVALVVTGTLFFAGSMAGCRRVGRAIVYPVTVLVSFDPPCEGTEIYVDGEFYMRLGDGLEMLSFRKGWHTIEARRRNCRSSRIRYQVTDIGQGDRETIVVKCSSTPCTLRVVVE